MCHGQYVLRVQFDDQTYVELHHVATVDRMYVDHSRPLVARVQVKPHQTARATNLTVGPTQDGHCAYGGWLSKPHHTEVTDCGSIHMGRARVPASRSSRCPLQFLTECLDRSSSGPVNDGSRGRDPSPSHAIPPQVDIPTGTHFNASERSATNSEVQRRTALRTPRSTAASPRTSSHRHP